MVGKFPPLRSERKKRSTYEGTPQFPNGISGKLTHHLTSFEICGFSGQMVSTQQLARDKRFLQTICLVEFFQGKTIILNEKISLQAAAL